MTIDLGVRKSIDLGKRKLINEIEHIVQEIQDSEVSQETESEELSLLHRIEQAVNEGAHDVANELRDLLREMRINRSHP